ncbi:fluoride efflux transporter CrcB [Aestuariirhabdus sp. Z084]|uniref:fluoride efflux transporter CrcB n=1 Tax=Aestuariirhabdus haliotis TaxID=2918751 RepID=UPI00201B3A86|nr:fluoride efflux transporter CrcB [Aestuariirhabdus haliotis]MCL6414880.1 fluoride efflux transporter CrcB [Aestuariirhabdus haliotis]MCL6418812.1 fluoride efflux transporter CrcB [Aestuariirhabdus haliotis]
MWQQLLFVGMGGALGAAARFSVYNLYELTGSKLFPMPTLIVNVVGSFLIGIAYFTIVERLQLPPVWKSGLITGFLGAFTTFSTYSLDALRMIQNGELGVAVGYLFASVVLCLIATLAGFLLVEKLFS